VCSGRETGRRKRLKFVMEECEIEKVKGDEKDIDLKIPYNLKINFEGGARL